MSKVIGYSGVELPVDKKVYDDNYRFTDKGMTEAQFEAGLYDGLTVEQQNSIRKMVGLPLFDTKLKDVLKPKG